jgi:soluble lytic murein transglycosylase-like protein
MTIFGRRRSVGVSAALCAGIALALAIPPTARAGEQVEESLSSSVRGVLTRAIADRAAPRLVGFRSDAEAQAWLDEMSNRLAPRLPNAAERRDLLVTVQYEATRAGLDPQLVLGLIHHESGFKKYAISVAGARGFMQVMPFWTRLIGSGDHNLFHLRTNLRYGCVILRHYLDIENGDLFRALGRYNGSLGRPEYPTTVVANWQRIWHWSPGARAAVVNAAYSTGPAAR